MADAAPAVVTTPAVTTPPPAPSAADAAKAPPEAAAAPAAAPDAKPAPEVDLQKRMGALAVRERKEREAAAALKAEREKLAADLAQANKLQGLLASAKRDPASLLKQAFGDQWREQLTDYLVNGAKLTPELVAAQVEERVAGLEERLKAEQAEARKAEDARLMANWQAEVTSAIKAKAETYELINLYDAHEQVQRLIQQHHAQTGELLTTEQAADKVEAALEERALKSKRLAAKLTPKPPPEPAKAAPAAPVTRATITNAMTASAAATPPPARSGDEAMQRALAILKAAAAARGT